MGSLTRKTNGGMPAGAMLALLLLAWASEASAASVNCRQWMLSGSEIAICNDAQLLRVDREMARRADRLARKLNFGQYLGLRHWEAEAAIRREACEGDRNCIAALFREQNRTLGRVEQCAGNRIARRSCLRNAIAGESEAARR